MENSAHGAPAASQRFVQENEQAEGLIDAQDLGGAAAILVSIVQQDPTNWRAYNNMGLLSWFQKAWEDAYSMFEHSVKLRPDYTDALINLFDAALKLKRVERIAGAFERAVELLPQDEEMRIIRDSIINEGEGIYLSERALSIGIHNPLIEEANALLNDGKYFDALEKYLFINDSQGPTAEAFCGLGIISYYQQRYDDAFSLFFEAIKLNPISHDHFLNFLDAARLSGKVALAKQVFDVYHKELPQLAPLADDFELAAVEAQQQE